MTLGKSLSFFFCPELKLTFVQPWRDVNSLELFKKKQKICWCNGTKSPSRFLALFLHLEPQTTCCRKVLRKKPLPLEYRKIRLQNRANYLTEQKSTDKQIIIPFKLFFSFPSKQNA